MNTVIYADILVIVNLIINYLLLRACAAITGHNFKAHRILLSAVIGGAFSLIIFIENISILLNVIIKILIFTVMIFVAFGIKNFKAFIKCCAAFFLVNFAFAGIMLAICITVAPNLAIYKNGIVYFDINILTLTVSAIICYVIISMISRFTKSKSPPKSIYLIRICCGDKSIECKSLFDSGNTLCDCFSGKPVIIAEKESVKNLIDGNDLTAMKNFRLIPFSTIRDGGALPAFMADRVEININGSWICSEEIYIAITEKKIISGGYTALFGVPFYSTVENSIKGGVTSI